MSQTPVKTGAKPKPIAVFRDKRGGMTPEMKQYVKDQNRVRKAILASLQAGKATVPEIAAAHGIESSRIMWQLMAMKRYGKVVEAEPRGDYFTYRLKEVT